MMKTLNQTILLSLLLVLSLIKPAFALTSVEYSSANTSMLIDAENVSTPFPVSDVPTAVQKIIASDIVKTTESVTYEAGAAPLNWKSGTTSFAVALDPSALEKIGTDTSTSAAIFRIPQIPFLGFTLGTQFAGKTKIWMTDNSNPFCSSMDGGNSTSDISCNYYSISGNKIYLTVSSNLYFYPNLMDSSLINLTQPTTYTGSVSIPVNTYSSYPVWWWYESNANYARSNLHLNFSVTLSPKVCQLNTADMNQTIDMGPISSIDLNGGDIQRGPLINFNFTCPNLNDVAIHLEMTDMNNLSNVTDTLSLKPIADSASGVGIKIKDQTSGGFVQFSNGNLASAQPIIKVVTSTGNLGTQNYTHTFAPYYTKTSTVTPGKVQAQAKVTFTYQ